MAKNINNRVIKSSSKKLSLTKRNGFHSARTLSSDVNAMHMLNENIFRLEKFNVKSSGLIHCLRDNEKTYH